MKQFSRREFLQALAAVSASQLPIVAFAEPPCEGLAPLDAQKYANLKETRSYGGLVTTMDREISVTLEMDHDFTNEIKGSLARVGPGLFDRGTQRKPVVIDADGMVRQYRIDGRRMTVQNAFVRTPKYIAEEKVQQFLYPSFAMKLNCTGYSPGFAGVRISSQASVTITHFQNRFLVTDEIQPIYQVDKDLLRTAGVFETDLRMAGLNFFAHTKTEPRTGELYLLAMHLYAGAIQVLTLDRGGRVRSQTDVVPTENSLPHDWAMTENHFVFLFPSLVINRKSILSVFTGRGTIAETISYDPNRKAEVVIVNKKSGQVVLRQPIDPTASWHTVNAFEENNRITLDFIGSTAPELFNLPNSPAQQIMRGELSLERNEQATELRRVVANLTTKSIEFSGELGGIKGLELPTVSPRVLGRKARFAYAVRGIEFLQTKIIKIDLEDGTHQEYDFGPGRYVSEPLFVPRQEQDDEDDGFVFVDVYDGTIRATVVHIFDAEEIQLGPIESVTLPVAFPIAFHGTWSDGARS